MEQNKKERRTPREWIALVEEQEMSIQTIGEFCIEHEIPQATFMYWRKKVKSHPQPEGAPSGFLKLKVGKVKKEDRILIRASRGIEIDLPANYPVSALQQLIKQVSC